MSGCLNCDLCDKNDYHDLANAEPFGLGEVPEGRGGLIDFLNFPKDLEPSERDFIWWYLSRRTTYQLVRRVGRKAAIVFVRLE